MAGLHEIRDPLHNFVAFNDLERSIIDSRPFQRLKRIKQLATTHYVYPGAMHTRFEHALGTMHLAGVAFDTLRAKGGSQFLATMGWSDEAEAARARQILRLGALLHDVGHSPFSHGPESLFSGGQLHEDFSRRLIEDEEISSLLAKSSPFSIPVEDVVFIAVGGSKAGSYPKDVGIRFLGELVFGDLGVDRIDYLNRDSLHLGVQYGRFDFARLINTLTYTKRRPEAYKTADDWTDEDPILAIESGGVHSAEGLYLARYFMFLQVYFHPVRSVYDLHLTKFMKAYLEETGDGSFPNDLDSYLQLSDVEIEHAINAPSESLAEVAHPLKEREHFRLARELFPKEIAAKPTLRDDLERSLQVIFGDDVLTDSAEKSSHSIGLGEMFVVDDDRTVDILDRSELIERVPPMTRLRIYSRRNRLDEVKKFLHDWLEENS